MHQIQKIRALYFINFSWNLMKCHQFLVLCMFNSRLKQFKLRYYCEISVLSFWRIFFSISHKKICQRVIFQNIGKYALIKPLQPRFKLSKIQILTAFYQISWKVDEIKCPYFSDLMHIWPYFGCLLFRPLLILKCIFFKKIWLNLFKNCQNSNCLDPNITLKA